MSRTHSAPVSIVVIEEESRSASVDLSPLGQSYDVRRVDHRSTPPFGIDQSTDVVVIDGRIAGVTDIDFLTALAREGIRVTVAAVRDLEPDHDSDQGPFDAYLPASITRDGLVAVVRVLADQAAFERLGRKFFGQAVGFTKCNAGDNPARGVADDHDRVLGRLTGLQMEMAETVQAALDSIPFDESRFELSTADTEQLLTAVEAHSLPTVLRDLVIDYQELKSARPPFMWKWVHRLAPHNTLPCVDEGFMDRVTVDKTLLILFITLLDDTLERHDDDATFAELSKIPFETESAAMNRDTVDERYVAFARRVWETLIDRLRGAPNYETYEALFRYDVKQAIVGMEYSRIAIRRPDLVTMTDMDRYESHNMVMFAYTDIDVMYSAADLRSEIPWVREAVGESQLMARIGNWLSTWERELHEGDFCSGPVVYALENDIVSWTELRRAPDDPELAATLVERIEEAGVEETFLRRWEQLYHRLHARNERSDGLDIGTYVDGLETVLTYHLASTGLK